MADDHPSGLASGGRSDARPEGEEEGEETGGRPPKVMGSPASVSKTMREEHEVTHLPYRSWCAHCVSGRGVSMGHRSKKDGYRDMETPRIAMD